ncbi:MAG: hypothetical protein L0Y56_21485 [Nitrospira sp.]|nr:hypothetical protein [Nitrospira sp.]
MDEVEIGIFSPDGAWKFLFAKEEDTNNDGAVNEEDLSILYLLHVGSSEKKQVDLPFPVEICAWGPEDMIAACSFAARDVNPSENTNIEDSGIIYLVNLETGELLRQLSDPTKSSWALEWSPDGSMLAFRVGIKTKDDLEIKGIQVVEVQTGELIYEVTEPTASEPVWSPDSTRLAFVAMLEAGEYSGRKVEGMYRDIFYVDLTNKTPTIVNVTKTSRFSEIPATLTHLGGVWVTDPLWSPDGKVIASVWARDRGDQIWVTSVDGEGWARLADGADYFLEEWKP